MGNSEHDKQQPLRPAGSWVGRHRTTGEVLFCDPSAQDPRARTQRFFSVAERAFKDLHPAEAAKVDRLRDPDVEEAAVAAYNEFKCQGPISARRRSASVRPSWSAQDEASRLDELRRRKDEARQRRNILAAANHDRFLSDRGLPVPELRRHTGAGSQRVWQ